MDKKLLVVAVAGLSHEFGIGGLQWHTMQSVFPCGDMHGSGKFPNGISSRKTRNGGERILFAAP